MTRSDKMLSVDWSAVLWSGVLATVLSLPLLFYIFPSLIDTTTESIIQYWASMLMGVSVISVPAYLSLNITLSAVLVHLLLTLTLTTITAIIFHHWGLLLGILGGALVGLCYYAINIYSMTYFFNWMFQLEGIYFMGFNVFLGALAGGLYEALEIVPSTKPNLEQEAE